MLSQLEGSGRGSLGAYNAGSWQDLHDHLHNVPMKDGEKWLAELCAKNEMLGELGTLDQSSTQLRLCAVLALNTGLSPCGQATCQAH